MLSELSTVGPFVGTNRVLEILRGERSLEGPCFHLSFDDGFDNNYRNAFPILEEFGIKATFFVPSRLVGSTDAETGSRLRPLTDSIPKCLTEIDGRPILERLVTGLRQQGFKRLVVVVGYLEPKIREFLDGCAGDLSVEYVRNPIYRTTNNIYSLWLAGRAIQESFLLVESDLVFDARLLRGLLIPDKIAVSRMLPC
jgi:hypothetical protein